MLAIAIPRFSCAQNITIGTKTLPAEVTITNTALIQGHKIYSHTYELLDYIRGVVRAEMGKLETPPGADDLTPDQKKKAYLAQAIAAATNLAAKGSDTVLNSEEHFQTFLPSGILGAAIDTLIDEAIPDVETAKQIIFYKGRVAEAKYFHGSLSGYTQNSYACNNNAHWYNAEMNRQKTPETLDPKKDSKADDNCGMSQQGAKYLASSLYGINAEQILVRGHRGR